MREVTTMVRSSMRDGRPNVQARVAILTLLLLVAAVVGAAMRGSGTQAQPPATNVTYAEGYDLDLSPEEAIAFDRNAIVVVADVVEALPAQWNTKSPTRGQLAFIFTPLKVNVLEVLRGDPRLDNGTMIVRKLGGRVGDYEFVVASTIDASRVDVGQRVLLFLGPQLITNSVEAATPNVVYVVDGNGQATSLDGRWSFDLAWVRARIK